MGHPLPVITGIALVIFAIAYLLCYLPRKDKTFDFDAGGKFGAFEPHASRYQDLAKLVLTLATASIAFLVNFLVNIPTDQKNRSLYSFRLEDGASWVVACLCVSVASLLLFLLLRMFFTKITCTLNTRVTPSTQERLHGSEIRIELNVRLDRLVLVLYGIRNRGLLDIGKTLMCGIIPNCTISAAYESPRFSTGKWSFPTCHQGAEF